MATIEPHPALFSEWDPLEGQTSDSGVVAAAQRREITNILKSYTGYYDLFSELIQNALDAVETRRQEGEPDYTGHIWICIDLPARAVSVTDNGCGMDSTQVRTFLRPNFSFKDGVRTRGNKGVGATYLGYGFNHLEVATKHNGVATSGIISKGREWVEDKSATITRPKFQYHPVSHAPFENIDRGTSFTVKLVGSSIRPRNLGWIGATTASQWAAILRVSTPLGGVYLCGRKPPTMRIELQVVDFEGKITQEEIASPSYLYPHAVVGRIADLREFLADQSKRMRRGSDVTRVFPKYLKLNGLWREWTIAQILGKEKSECPICARLDKDEETRAIELGASLYIFLGF